MILMNNLQGKNGDEDIENGLGNTLLEREGGVNTESSINMYTLSTVRWTAGEKLPCSTESPDFLVLCDDLEGWDGGKGRLRTDWMYV